MYDLYRLYSIQDQAFKLIVAKLNTCTVVQVELQGSTLVDVTACCVDART